MTFNELVPKAYCMNLYSSGDRWNAVSKQFAREGLNVERFNAVNGAECKPNKALRAGNVGNNVSHMVIIKMAALMGLPAVLIFEDDAVLRPGFLQKMDEVLKALPDNFDILYLGGSHSIPPTKITDKIYRVHETYCTHAYIIRDIMYETVLDKLEGYNAPVDCGFVELQKDYHCYVTNPPMAWQAPGHSLIEDKFMNYAWIEKPLK